VLVTSLGVGAADEIAMLAADAHGAWLVRTPRLPVTVNGAGDLTAALFLAGLLRTGEASRALGAAASAVWAVIEATWRLGAPELAIIAAQDLLASPPRIFAPEPVA
jgi:pyridoxine kinase